VLDLLLTAFRQLQVYKLMQVSSFTLLCFDYFLTFTEEVELIWKRKWGLASVLYIATRYLPFFDTIVLQVELFDPNPTPFRCKAYFHCICWSYCTGIAVAESILTLRTYAICKKNKIILAILICTQLVTTGMAYYYTNIFLKALRFAPSPFPTELGYTGCFVSQANDSIWLDYLLTLITEGVILGMTIGYILYQGGYNYSPFVRRIQRDGIMFYVYLQVFSIANIIVLHVTPLPLHLSACSFHRILHASLTARLLLNIRRAAIPSEMDTKNSSGSSSEGPNGIELHGLRPIQTDSGLVHSLKSNGSKIFSLFRY